jgi:hypothetical protein
MTLPAHTQDGKTLQVKPGPDFRGKPTISIEKFSRGEWREVVRAHFAPHDARALAHALLECAGRPVTPVAAEGLAE